MAARKNTASKSDQIRTLLASGLAPAEIAEKVGCSRNLVYLVKSKQGGAAKGKSRRRTAPKSQPAARSTSGNGSVDQFLVTVKELERERDELREVVNSIRQIVSRLS